jgi:nucleoid DNA-binding protein
VTKKDMARRIAEETNLPQEVVQEIVQRLLDGIIATLEKERRIELRNFGVFEVKQRKPRKGSTSALPPTKEEIEKLLAIAARYGIEIKLPRH